MQVNATLKGFDSSLRVVLVWVLGWTCWESYSTRISWIKRLRRLAEATMSDRSDGIRAHALDTLPWVLIADLTHFLSLPEDAPGPARRLAEQLGGIVRAATAGDAGTAWTSALPCRRRPGNRLCPGRMIVLRVEPSAPIQWRCSVCADEGVISNWQDCPYDLRPRRFALAAPCHQFAVPDQVAATLRGLHLLDPDTERLVFAIGAHPDGAEVTATADELVELIGFVAAEANHETDRRRQRRIDTAFDVLNEALVAMDG